MTGGDAPRYGGTVVRMDRVTASEAGADRAVVQVGEKSWLRFRRHIRCGPNTVSH